MALRTAFTELLGIKHPIALAPMGGSAGGELAAAVSSGGGLGLVGGGRSDTEWVERELANVTSRTEKPWGVGFLTWGTNAETVRCSLEHEPDAVMLSFGDPGPLATLVKRSRAKLIVQVVDMEEARRAVDVGADVVVAQGSEAGGHGGTRATFPFVPAVVDLVRPIPVLAAGGIADGRGLAAALSLGASGVLVGTRFQASREAIVDAEIVKAIVNGAGDETERSRVLDIARGAPWPGRYTGRTIRNDFLDRWREREEELRTDSAAIEEYRQAEERGDTRVIAVWASEAIDLITESLPAAEIVKQMAAVAEESLRNALGRN